MDFEKIVYNCQIVHRRDVKEDRAEFALLFMGGNVTFYAPRNSVILGVHAQVTVKARLWAPGRVEVTVEYPKVAAAVTTPEGTQG